MAPGRLIRGTLGEGSSLLELAGKKEGGSPVAMGKAPEKEDIPGQAEADVKGGLSLMTSLSRQNRQT